MTYFEVKINDQAAGSYGNAVRYQSGYVYGTLPFFSAFPSGTIAYNSIVNHNPPASSTWVDGTYDMDSLSPWYRGDIDLHYFVPEPSFMGLGTLAFATLLLRRRAGTKQLQSEVSPQ